MEPSTVNFCEDDVRISAWAPAAWGLSLEPFNLLSSLFMVLSGIIGLYNMKLKGLSPLYCFGPFFVAQVLVGMGSSAFHGTMTRLGQCCDELAMLLLLHSLLWTLVAPLKAGGGEGGRNASGSKGCSNPSISFRQLAVSFATVALLYLGSWMIFERYLPKLSFYIFAFSFVGATLLVIEVSRRSFPMLWATTQDEKGTASSASSSISLHSLSPLKKAYSKVSRLGAVSLDTDTYAPPSLSPLQVALAQQSLAAVKRLFFFSVSGFLLGCVLWAIDHAVCVPAVQYIYLHALWHVCSAVCGHWYGISIIWARYHVEEANLGLLPLLVTSSDPSQRLPLALKSQYKRSGISKLLKERAPLFPWLWPYILPLRKLHPYPAGGVRKGAGPFTATREGMPSTPSKERIVIFRNSFTTIEDFTFQ